MTLIIAGVRTPFIVNVSVFGEGGDDTVFSGEFDTFLAAKAALEAFIIDNQDVADDYTIGARVIDVYAGDIVRYNTVTLTAADGRTRQKHTTTPVGVWAISWRKPEPSLAELRKAVMAAE